MKSNFLSNTVQSKVSLAENFGLKRYGTLAQFAFYSLLNKPLVGVNSKVAGFSQEGDQEAAQTQRSTAKIEQEIVRSKPQGTEQTKLGCTHEIILSGRPDECHVVAIARFQL